MFPTPLPETVIRNPAREAERDVYTALQAQLDDGHLVFYSVAWLAKSKGEGARDGEVDFVVANPQKGILLLEVKGGQVCRDGVSGRWVSIDHSHHEHAIHDPFEQVRVSKHALLQKLAEHPAIGRAWVALGHGVVLPASHDPHRPLTPDGPREITVFAEDMAHVADRVARMFDYWNGEMGGSLRPTPLLVSTLKDMLAPSFHLRQPLGEVLADEDRELLRLTEDQFDVLDMLSRQRRVAVSGGAGTGKTVLALEKARRLAAEGCRVLFTCFNKPLAEFLRRSAGAVERLEIANFHEFCWRMARDAGLPLPEPNSELPSGFFNTTCRTRCSRHSIASPIAASTPSSWTRGRTSKRAGGRRSSCAWRTRRTASSTCSTTTTSRCTAASSSFPAGLNECVLRDNLRNTRRIHAVTTKFYRGEPLRAKGPEGRDVECIAAETPAAAVREIQRLLHRLVREEGVPRARRRGALRLVGERPTEARREDRHLLHDHRPGRGAAEGAARFGQAFQRARAAGGHPRSASTTLRRRKRTRCSTSGSAGPGCTSPWWPARGLSIGWDCDRQRDTRQYGMTDSRTSRMRPPPAALPLSIHRCKPGRCPLHRSVRRTGESIALHSLNPDRQSQSGRWFSIRQVRHRRAWVAGCSASNSRVLSTACPIVNPSPLLSSQ